MVTDVSEILDKVVDKQMEQFKKLNIITNVSDEEFREVLKSIYKDIVCLLYTSPSPRDRG